MISNEEIIDVCGRIGELLARKPCRDWTVFIQVCDYNGQPEWLFDFGVPDCDTADEAAAKAVKLLRYDDGVPRRISRVWAIPRDQVVTIDGYRFAETPQFEMRY